MAWILIILGIILMSVGIYTKYKNIEKNKEYFSDGEILIKKQNRLEEISRELDIIISEIQAKEKEIARAVKNFEISSYKHKGSFQKVLEQSYNNISDKRLKKKNLPEKYSKILKLADRGMKSDEIAAELDLGIRETELILKIYRNGVDNDEG